MSSLLCFRQVRSYLLRDVIVLCLHRQWPPDPDFDLRAISVGKPESVKQVCEEYQDAPQLQKRHRENTELKRRCEQLAAEKAMMAAGNAEL